jgi:hypothetical protein
MMLSIMTQVLGRVVIYPDTGMSEGATITPELFTFPIDFGLVSDPNITFAYDLGVLV